MRTYYSQECVTFNQSIFFTVVTDMQCHASLVLSHIHHCIHTYYPLLCCILEHWLSWLQDEIPLASVEEACLNLRKLFDRAVDDYLCKKRVW